MRARRVAVFFVQICLSAIVLAQEQPARPPFRAGVELVQLDVAVLDDKRQPVTGLTAEDFTVLDNGTPTPIRAFVPVELEGRTRASEAAWATEVAPDVSSNQIGNQEGRLVIILMDRSTPPEQPSIVAQKIAAAAVQALGPHDLAAVVTTSNGSVQNLTADRTLLLNAIGAGVPSAVISDEALAIVNKTGFQIDDLNDGRCLCGVCVLDTITRVANALEGTTRRRKLLLFIGSRVIWQVTGSVATVGANTGCEAPLKDARARAFAAVDRANLTVHSIDPQGITNIGDHTRAAVPNAPPGGAGGGRAGGAAVDLPSLSGSAGSRLAKLQTDLRNNISNFETLRVLPERTGGRTITRNDPEALVPEILRESQSYYLIGIERAQATRADATRSIDVKVKRKGLHVAAQRVYATGPSAEEAPATIFVEGAPASAQDALSRLMPNPSKPLSLAVTPFASVDAPKPVVRVNVDAGSFVPKDGRDVPLDVAIIAVDRTGKLVASAHQTSTVSSPPSTTNRSFEANVQSHLELPPGVFEVRVAVTDPATGQGGSVFSNVVVPKFDDAPLSLSGFSVEAAHVGSTQSTVTTRRAFKRTDQVRAVTQIYQGTGRTDAIVPVTMRVQIVDAKGTSVRDQSLPFAAAKFENRRADCVITLPLTTLTAGEYLLKLEASADRQTSTRALRFVVE